ncbi:cyclic pyranopterin monophosphate synthase MoaC [Thermaerobacter sp. FW80]|uniref:cyclic pyranopterin monophosphate synthase MoaC n=1 Tax=Thermaerobacter sp. FW80 TaxID=2546351 RepID=UPI00143084E2
MRQRARPSDRAGGPEGDRPAGASAGGEPAPAAPEARGEDAGGRRVVPSPAEEPAAPVPSGAPAWTHLDAAGRAQMVDTSGKAVTVREAVARGRVRMAPTTLARLRAGDVPKGDVWAVARVAGILAAKETGRLIPLCHPLPLDTVAVDFRLTQDAVEIQATVRTAARTGVEMEALTAVAVAALTLVDMGKALDKGMVVEGIRLVRKTGGRSGDYWRAGEPPWEAVGEPVRPEATRAEGGRSR